MHDGPVSTDNTLSDTEPVEGRPVVDIEARNRTFYNALYGGSGALAHLIRARFSFDQRSKAEPNRAVLDPILDVAGRRNVRLLDYGCGWGTLLLALRRRPVTLYGYDLSPMAVPSVARAAALLGAEVNEIQRGRDGQLDKRFWDVIVCSHVLEHVPDDQTLLKHFHRALVTDGHLLLNVPVNEVWNDPKHIRSYTPGEVEMLVGDAGFRVVDRRTVDRWTALLLKHAEGAGRLRRIALRVLRSFLSLPPWKWVEISGEWLFASHHPRQQLILLCQKEVRW